MTIMMPVQSLVQRTGFPIALVCMPFASADRPSIQLGLVGAIAEAAGFETDLHHFNLDLAAQIGPRDYELLCDRRAHMTGDWLFAPAAFGTDAPGTDDGYLAAFPSETRWVEDLKHGPDYLSELRHKILPDFVDACLEAVDWGIYGVVGFSSLFQQNVASLALARRIKARWPEVVIVFGGANMEGEMGLECARAFPCIDFVVSGEADEVFPALLHALAAGGPIPPYPGLIWRQPDGSISGGGHAGPIDNLNDLPTPNYEPYFRRARELSLVDHYKETWVLPFESSRGCWWGQKHHCTFCGLNGLGMGFRAKTAERTLAELTELADRHQICSFMAVDNILDMKYIQEMFHRLAEDKIDYNFFYETKSNLTVAQIRTLYRGGIRRIQPGIESMNSHVLSLMRKGCTMLQNVLCLKWCRYYGIGVNWNLIWGFPGETEDDYSRELEVLKNLSHLEPPVGSGRIWLERFSPNYEDRKTFPVKNVQAEASYGFVYPRDVDLQKLAYFFDYEMEGATSADIHVPTYDYLESWRDSWKSPERHSLTYRRTAGALLIDVNRGDEGAGTYAVTGANAMLYEHCSDTPRTPQQAADHLRATGAFDYDADDVRGALDLFCERRLMLTENDRYLSLALPSNPNW